MPPPLHHIHLGRIPFHATSHLQSLLRASFLASKLPSTASPPPPPPPTLLTSVFEPTYTLGRRSHSPPPALLSHLSTHSHATVAATQRGGQTTFHGPGQVTGYVLLDLSTFHLTPRCYIRLLEESVIALLRGYGVSGRVTEDPGVWVDDGDRGGGKICAVGVQMRRYVAAFGVGVNVHPDLWWFSRIVPCGLRGKRATSLREVGVGVSTDEVAEGLAKALAGRLGVDVVEGTVQGTGVIGAQEWREVVEREWAAVKERTERAEVPLAVVREREMRVLAEGGDVFPPEITGAF